MTSINAALNSISALTALVNSIQATSDNIIWNEVPSGNADGINDTFTLAYLPIGPKVLVFVNGVLKEQDAGEADYSITGQTITFTDPPFADSKIFVTYAKSP